MPLFGDMKMKPFDTYVKNSVHFNANKWPLSNSTTTSNQVDISGKGMLLKGYDVIFSRPTSCTILRKCVRTISSLLANSPGGLMMTCNLLNRFPCILTQAQP